MDWISRLATVTSVIGIFSIGFCVKILGKAAASGPCFAGILFFPAVAQSGRQVGRGAFVCARGAAGRIVFDMVFALTAGPSAAPAAAGSPVDEFHRRELRFKR